VAYFGVMFDAITKLLSVESTMDCLTVEAINHILRFYLDNQAIRQGLELRAELRNMGVQLRVENFNLWMEVAANRENVSAFYFALKDMIKRGLRPNAATWRAFLLLDMPYFFKMHVTDLMMRRNLLRDPELLQQTLAETLDGRTAQWLEADQPPLGIVEALDRSFGHDWLAQMTVGRILNEFGTRGYLKECIELLDVTLQRGLTLTEGLIVTVLAHCARQQRVDIAIAVVRLAEHYHFAVKQSKLIHRVLFNVARLHHSYNLTRVIWVSACVNDAASAELRAHMLKRLRSCVKWQQVPDATHADVRFRIDYAKVVVGFRPALDKDEAYHKFCVKAAICANDLHLKRNRKRAIQAQRLKGTLVAEDLASRIDPRPEPSRLWRKMRDAVAMDREWKESGFYQTSSLMEKVERVIYEQWDFPAAGSAESITSERPG
jgi:hypothetical protein